METVKPYKSPTRMTIEKGKNGFTLRKSMDDGEVMMVAKDLGEMMGMMGEMVGDSKYSRTSDGKMKKK